MMYRKKRKLRKLIENHQIKMADRLDTRKKKYRYLEQPENKKKKWQ